MEHLELVELNNASFTFICLKSTPEQWHQFCVSNSKIQNLQIIEKNFDINIFKELTILKELRRLDIKSNHQNQSEAFHCAVMMRENCKNLIEMNLSEFSVKNTQTGFCYYENSSDEDDVET